MHPGAETVPLPPPEEFVVAFNRQRFAQLAIGAPIAMCVGVTYSFGLISNYMKERWDMSQGDLTTISTVANLMGMFSLPGGILFDLVGPQYALMSAMTLTSGGFILLALIFSDVVTASIPLLAFANGLTWWGTGFMDVGSLMTNLFSFPLTQGEVVIVQKTFMGLGSTFLSLIFSAFFAQGEKYVAYCYFVAGMVIFILSLGCIVTRLSPYKRTTIITKKYEKCERIVGAFTGSPSTGGGTGSDGNDAMSLATRDDETAAIQKKRGTHEESQLLGAAATDDAVDGTLPTEEEYVKAVEYIKDRDKREAYSYYVAHTRSYLDRRRVNLSLALLWSCLIFFAAVSFANASIEMSNDAHYALAIVGALLIASFILLLVPCKLPSLFNFGFLPSLVPVSEDAASDEEDATVVSGGVKINGDSGAGGRTSIRASRRRIAAGEATAEGQLEQGVGAVDEVNYLWMDGKDGGQPSEAVRRSMNASAARNRQPISTISGDGEPPAVAELEQLEKWLGIGPIYRGKIPCVETTFFQNLKTIPIVWCFLYNSFAVWGCGSLFVSNSTQIYKSLNGGEYSQTTNSLYVAIMGIASALGRVVVGYIQMKIKSNNSIRHRGQRSDLNDKWEKWVAMDLFSDLELSPSAKTWLSTIRPVHYDMWASITVLLPIPALMTCVATVLTITLPVSAVALPLFTSAFAFGMSWALTVLSIKEIYQADVAKMYNINFLGAMLAAILLNRLMFGSWYDQETERQHDHRDHVQNGTATTPSPDSRQTCAGVACIESSMLVCLGLNAAAAVVMTYVVWWLRAKRRSDPIPAFITTATSGVIDNANKEQ